MRRVRASASKELWVLASRFTACLSLHDMNARDAERLHKSDVRDARE
jgi:hypothetical protein